MIQITGNQFSGVLTVIGDDSSIPITLGNVLKNEVSFTIGTKGFINPMNLRFDIRVGDGVIYEDLYDGDDLLSTTVHQQKMFYSWSPWCEVETDHKNYILITRFSDNKSISIDWNEETFNEMKTIFSRENT